MLQRLNSSLSSAGIRGTSLKLWATCVDKWFDLRFSVDTCGVLELKDLTTLGTNRYHGYKYQTVPVLALRRVFHAIEDHLPRGGVLVDMGSGKGRVLLIGAEFGFSEVRGVEFTHELCEVARKNVARFRRRRAATSFTVIEADAAAYEIRPEENVFIMCNPFDSVILGAVLDNIANSLRASPRMALLVYCNPRWQSVIEARQDFVEVLQVPFPGYNFAIFSHSSQRAL